MTQLIIPMSGKGDRFKKAGYAKLKPLIQIDGKSIVEHVLEMFPKVEKNLFIINQLDPQASDLKAELLRIRPDADVVEIEPHKLGPSWAIWSAREFIHPNMKLVISYCDFKATWKLEDMLSQLDEFDGSVLTYTGFHPHMVRNDKYAYVKKNGAYLEDIQEKNPYTSEPMREEASAGVYGFRSRTELLKALELQFRENLNFNGEFYTSLTIKALLDLNLSSGTVSASSFCQWGTPEDLEDWMYYNAAVGSALEENIGNAQNDIPGSCLILAAGKGARLSKLTNVSKPNIPIGTKRLWDFSLDIAKQFKSRLVVTRREIDLDSKNLQQIRVHNLEDFTEGQAHTAHIALELLESEPDSQVTILSADNLVGSRYARSAIELIENCDLLVWTSAKYPPAQLQANQYSWVDVSDEGLIIDVKIKNSPKGLLNPQMIIGNFTFKSKKFAQLIIQELLDSGITVNGEFYLDSVINLALSKRLIVRNLEITNFMAIGTEIEFETFQYFEKEQIHGG